MSVTIRPLLSGSCFNQWPSWYKKIFLEPSLLTNGSLRRCQFRLVWLDHRDLYGLDPSAWSKFPSWLPARDVPHLLFKIYNWNFSKKFPNENPEYTIYCLSVSHVQKTNNYFEIFYFPDIYILWPLKSDLQLTLSVRPSFIYCPCDHLWRLSSLLSLSIIYKS